jgi:hypothetical protein
MQDVFFALDVNGVPGIVASLSSDDYISFLGQNVDDLTFAFIAPLGAHEYGIGHRFNKNPRR